MSDWKPKEEPTATFDRIDTRPERRKADVEYVKTWDSYQEPGTIVEPDFEWQNPRRRKTDRADG